MTCILTISPSLRVTKWACCKPFSHAAIRWSRGENLQNGIVLKQKDWDSEFGFSTCLGSIRIEVISSNPQNWRLTMEDLKIHGTVVSRINTLYQRTDIIWLTSRADVYALISSSTRYWRTTAFWWTHQHAHQRHNGKLWNLNNYRTDMIQDLRVIEGIIKHNLPKG